MIWENDKLNRKQEADYLTNYIDRKYQVDGASSLSINLNATWGYGKTFFLKNLEQDLIEKKHPVVYYDAWQNDFANEALVSLIAEISSMLTDSIGTDPVARTKIEKLKKHSIKLFKSSVPILANALVKHTLKTSIDDILDDSGEQEVSEELNESISTAMGKISGIAASNLLQEHQQTKTAIKDFRGALTALVEFIESDKDPKIKLPIYVLIDELDRCKPTFAIDVLEAVKHLFGVHGFIFITATNTKELQSSVKAVYGSEFSANTYLHRFFDIEYSFVEPDYFQFSKLLLEGMEFDDHINVHLEHDPACDRISLLFSKLSTWLKLTLRDMEQVKIALEACLFTIKPENKASFELPLMLILLMMKQMNLNDGLKLFNIFSESERNKELEGFIKKYTSNVVINTHSIAELTNRNNPVEESMAISEILKTYLILKDKKTDTVQNHKPQYVVTGNIQSALSATIFGVQTRADGNIVDYLKYFEMMNFSGRFSTNEIEK